MLQETGNFWNKNGSVTQIKKKKKKRLEHKMES